MGTVQSRVPVGQVGGDMCRTGVGVSTASCGFQRLVFPAVDGPWWICRSLCHAAICAGLEVVGRTQGDAGNLEMVSILLWRGETGTRGWLEPAMADLGPPYGQVWDPPPDSTSARGRRLNLGPLRHAAWGSGRQPGPQSSCPVSARSDLGPGPRASLDISARSPASPQMVQ